VTSPSEYEWDVALSFAGDQRPFVEAVAARLLAADLRVFYDSYQQVGLWMFLSRCGPDGKPEVSAVGVSA
jgi:hypothetical protein